MGNIARRQEFYFDFDTHCEQNFASYSSLEQAIKATEQNIRKLSTGDYEEFINTLNHARALEAAKRRSYILKQDRFTVDDFAGVLVFPTTAILPLYRKKYGGLHPIHLFIAVPKKNMDDIKRKISFPEELPEVTFPNTYFPSSAMGLHHTGVSLLEKPKQITAIEYFSLTWDATYYSRGFQTVMQQLQFAAQKRYEQELPKLACFALEYMLLFEIFAYHALIPSEKAVINRYSSIQKEAKEHAYTRLRRVGIQQRILAQYPASDPQKYKNAFEELAVQQCAQTEKVIDALYFLEERLGSNLLLPAIFAVGPTKEELRQQGWNIGPFTMLQAFAFSVNSGIITRDHVYHTILEKGYSIGSSRSGTDPAFA